MRTTFAVLVVLWATGFANSYTYGSLVLVLLVITGGVTLIEVLSGPRPKDLT